MQKYSNNIINQYGAPVAGASVKILSTSGSLALIYSDNNSSLLTNPIISDEYGQFSFYAKNGRYSIAIEKQGVISQTLQDILLDDLSDSSGNIVISAAASSIVLRGSASGNPNGIELSAGGAERLRIDSTGNIFTNGGQIGAHPSITETQLILNGGSAMNTGGASIVVRGNTAGYNDGGIEFYAGGVERARINSSTGDVTVSSPAKLGYGTGAGGSVTQATSKSTAVTLHKPCGQINTHAAALADGAVVAFTLNNSQLLSTDTIVIHRGAGGAALSYQVWVDSVGPGAAYIVIKNISASPLSESVNIVFAIIKGAAS